MVNSWFCSDHHLAHFNIIQYGDRPFASLANMHDALLTYHNETVKSNDHVNFLGDVTIKRGGRLDREWFIAEMRKYHGHKRLYLGNHDHFPIKVYLDAGFEKIYATWRTEEGLLCSHFPLHPRSIGSAIANIHGHIHQNPVYDPILIVKEDGNRIIKPYINVSVEAIGYKPIHKDTLLAQIRKLQGE